MMFINIINSMKVKKNFLVGNENFRNKMNFRFIIISSVILKKYMRYFVYFVMYVSVWF